MCDVDWPILYVEGRCVQMKKKYIKRYFRMEPDLVNEMDEFCRKTKLLKTHFIAEAIIEYLEKQKKYQEWIQKSKQTFEKIEQSDLDAEKVPKKKE